jgi:hypothetical protein
VSFDAAIADTAAPAVEGTTQATAAAPSPASAAPASPTVATPDAAPEAGDTTFDIEVSPAAEGETPTAEGDTPAAEGEPPAAEVPEVYADFAAPEGVALDPALVEDLKGVAKELKLTQEGAQKLADLGVKQAQAFVAAGEQAVAAEQASWLTASRADAEIGGEKLKATLADAKAGLAAFGSPQIGEFLRDTKLNTHPEFIRLFAKLGKLVAEDKFVPSSPTATNAEKSYADRLYPTKKGK